MQFPINSSAESLGSIVASVHTGANDHIRSMLNLWDPLGNRTGAQRKQRREGGIIHEELNSIYQESVLCSCAGWSPELLHL